MLYSVTNSDMKTKAVPSGAPNLAQISAYVIRLASTAILMFLCPAAVDKIKAQPIPYIVYGQQAARDAWPWQAAIYLGGNLSCGGSVIASYWIVTAAHCVFQGSSIVAPAQLNVLLGTNNLTLGGQLYSITKIIPHPGYNNQSCISQGRCANDIALLQLRSAAVPRNSTTYNYKNVTPIG